MVIVFIKLKEFLLCFLYPQTLPCVDKNIILRGYPIVVTCATVRTYECKYGAHVSCSFNMLLQINSSSSMCRTCRNWVQHVIKEPRTIHP